MAFSIHWEVALTTSAKRTNPASNIHRRFSINFVSFKVRGPKKPPVQIHNTSVEVFFCSHTNHSREGAEGVAKVAVHPRKHCVISYVHIQREIRARAWGQNNSPALQSTVFIRGLRLRGLRWSAGTHGKALPSNAERRARRSVQRDGSPYAF